MIVSDLTTLSGFQKMVSDFPILLGSKPFTHKQTVAFEVGVVTFLIFAPIVEIIRQKYPLLLNLLFAIALIGFMISTFISLCIATNGYFAILFILFFIPLYALLYS